MSFQFTLAQAVEVIGFLGLVAAAVVILRAQGRKTSVDVLAQNAKGFEDLANLRKAQIEEHTRQLAELNERFLSMQRTNSELTDLNLELQKRNNRLETLNRELEMRVEGLLAMIGDLKERLGTLENGGKRPRKRGGANG